MPASNQALQTAEPDASDDKAAAGTIEFMREYYAAQEKVSIRCLNDEWVQVNGYTFIIKAGERVMVPKDIAQILEDAGRI